MIAEVDVKPVVPALGRDLTLLRRVVESAVLEAGDDGLLRVRLPEGDEGFLRGLALLAGEGVVSAEERSDVLALALAS